MARPLRLECAGAIYHLTQRGNDRQKGFFTAADRALFLTTLARVVRRYGRLCHANCVMANHDHLLAQCNAAKPSLARIFAKSGKKAIAVAYEHGYRLKGIAAHLGVDSATVSRRLKQLERSE